MRDRAAKQRLCKLHVRTHAIACRCTPAICASQRPSGHATPRAIEAGPARAEAVGNTQSKDRTSWSSSQAKALIAQAIWPRFFPN
ncbi:hypothetical protein ACTYEO_07820 [Rhodophyticola sp. SM2404]